MISVVIPAYNEARALPLTLDALSKQTGCYEVIVADGGSTDGTVAIAAGRARLVSAPKGRASQMNAGAAVARGDWLLFLHADTCLPPRAIACIQELPDSVQAGGFRHAFTGRSLPLRLTSWLDNYRCRKTGVIYGDQALFVRARLFRALGGFPSVLMEDVAFGETLLRHTRPRLLDQAIVTDSRKFDQQGPWRSLARVLLILLCSHWNLRRPAVLGRFFEDVR